MRVTVSADFGADESMVRVLTRLLQDGGIEVLDVLEVKTTTWTTLPDPVNLVEIRTQRTRICAYGPLRKGRGGKAKRWRVRPHTLENV